MPTSSENPSPKPPLTLEERKQIQAKAFEPLAVELGWITYEWNRLHESLGEIFAIVIAGADADKADDVRASLAAWHSLTNERAQREMLRVAIGGRYLPGAPRPNPVDEVSWLLEKLNPVAGRRNDAIHAPMAFINRIGADEAAEVEVMPLHFFGNPRAVSLKDKSLPEEFRWYRAQLERLADYAESLIFAMKFTEYKSPARPILPPRSPT
jgi:hypothetical protein